MKTLNTAAYSVGCVTLD